MIRPYRWILHAEAVECFETLSKRKRTRLLRAFQFLAAHPFAPPRARTKDAEHGVVSIAIESDIAISYDVDHAVRQVHIFRLDPDSASS